jgi:hypothetical protein
VFHVCDYCKESFQRPGRAKTARVFCSRSCKAKGLATRPTFTCEWCGKQYKTRPRKGLVARYCSRTCDYAARDARRIRIERTCQQCQKVFNFRPSSGIGLYCSTRCRGDAQKIRPIKSCLTCGATFRVRKNGQGVWTSFCSRRCAGQSSKQRENGARLALGRWIHRKYDWSVNFPKCQRCGSDKKRHVARGYCAGCYSLFYQRQRGFLPREEGALPTIWPYIPASTDLTSDDIVLRVHGLVPSTLADDVRAEVGQEIMLAVLEKRLTVEQIPQQLPRFVQRAYRNLREIFGGISLEAPVKINGQESGLTLRESLVSPY